MMTTQRSVSGPKLVVAAWFATAVSLSGYTPVVTAHSNDGALWGIGGLLAGSMLTSAHYKKHEHQQNQSTTPASAAPMTAEQKIQQLNALAAGGYITPQEYKTEKQAILNSIVD
jgi:hypothetical protein